MEIQVLKRAFRITKDLYFPGQRDGEKVILLIRKHWIEGVKQFLKLLAFIVIPLIARTVLHQTADGLQGGLFFELLDVAFLIYLLVLSLVWYIGWLNIYLDVVIVTNERLIDVDQISLFKRQISESNLLKLQDITSSVLGFMGTLLGYGYLQLETAGEMGGHLFKIGPVGNPQELSRKILDIVDELMKKHKEFQKFADTEEGSV